MIGLSKNKIRYISSLKNKKNRDEYDVFVAEGDKLVGELLRFAECDLLVATPLFLSDVRDNCNLDIIPEIIEVDRKDIEKISIQKNPQQCVAVFKQFENSYELSDLTQNLSLVLDGIQDPGNLGTIIRLADWYGIEHIFCSKDTADIYNSKVVQATMGALLRVNVHYVDLLTFLESLPDHFSIYGTFLDGDDMYKASLNECGIIIMGNEGNGIRPEVEKYVTERLFIPNYPVERKTSESLNVSVATAIVCGEFRRRIIM